MTTLSGMLITAAAGAAPMPVAKKPRARAHTSPPPPGISQRLVLVALLTGTMVVIALVVHQPGGLLL